MIKSLSELKKYREEQYNEVKLREMDEHGSDITEIAVEMGTSGIAAGAREVLNSALDAVFANDLHDVKVLQVGSLGFAGNEPKVRVTLKGKEPVIYGNACTNFAKKIVEKHIMEGEILEDHIVKG